jgi:hypothetical protein
MASAKTTLAPIPRMLGPLLTALALLGACQETEERPARLGRECADASSLCFPPPISGGGGSGGAGDAGEGGPASDAGEETTRSVSGTVALFDDDTFVAAQHFGQSALVSAEGAAGTRRSVLYNGVDFTLDGVRVSPENWFFIEPAGSGVDALTTLEPVDTSIDPLELVLVRASALELMYGVLSQPVSLDMSAGHVVLRFFNPLTNEAVSGISVAMAQAALVAYADAGTWSDVSTSTGASGLAVLGNVAALAAPGSRHLVTIAGIATGTLEVVVAGGAVSLADVAIEP